MFRFAAKKEPVSSLQFVIARLNARVQPIDRGEFFEDPLHSVLTENGLGEVTGGGTMLGEDPDGIAYCEVEIGLNSVNDQALAAITATLEGLGAPKGSSLLIEDDEREIPFGTYEGLALFLNGVDLPDDTYENCDVNDLIEMCETKLADHGSFKGHWQGARETGLYFYGPSFSQMQIRLTDLIESYPLCQKCRIVQIA